MRDRKFKKRGSSYDAGSLRSKDNVAQTVFRGSLIKEIPNTFKIKSPEHGGYNANIVSIEVDDNGTRKMVTYWEEKGKYGTEIYQGKNYVEPFDIENKYPDKYRSYSRNYVFWKDMPIRWMLIAHSLRDRHQQIFKPMR